MTERCCVCGKFISEYFAWGCSGCEGLHHEKCSGDNYEGSGEYPDEDAYSYCQKCVDKAIEQELKARFLKVENSLKQEQEKRKKG